MTTLITNDDGDSQGLRILFEAAKEIDNNAYAIIPNRQRSAIGCALTLHKPLRLHETRKGTFTVNGTPSDCALFGIHSEEFKKPEFLLSGINWGDNTGMGPLVGSGTIGACWQAALNGIPAMAFSIEATNKEWRKKESWGDETKLRQKTVELINKLKPMCKPFEFLNVNIPKNFENSEIEFVETIQRKRYTTEIAKRTDPENEPYYWITGQKVETGKGTDFAKLREGKIVVTRIALSAFKIQ
ncbi:5'/3'-nucleotidase SurE [Candidatus Micrarchaeota archaeon]|nr:5'/3'-nucleotidase SurE [Candidatus Micrarchaeota archaeon]